jgi:hypothetical protein
MQAGAKEAINAGGGNPRRECQDIVTRGTVSETGSIFLASCNDLPLSMSRAISAEIPIPKIHHPFFRVE